MQFIQRVYQNHNTSCWIYLQQYSCRINESQKLEVIGSKQAWIGHQSLNVHAYESTCDVIYFLIYSKCCLVKRGYDEISGFKAYNCATTLNLSSALANNHF